jgi:hypothetical protein
LKTSLLLKVLGISCKSISSSSTILGLGISILGGCLKVLGEKVGSY